MGIEQNYNYPASFPSPLLPKTKIHNDYPREKVELRMMYISTVMKKQTWPRQYKYKTLHQQNKLKAKKMLGFNFKCT